MANILVTGANGQLGSELQVLAKTHTNHVFIFTDVAELDITDLANVSSFFQKHGIQYCINCAAYTQVDKAETDQDLCYKINELGAKNLAIASEQQKAALFQISTDFVFGGIAHRPLTEDQPTAPQGVYAASKLAGELAVIQACASHIVIRTSWLYSTFGANFVKTMRKYGKERGKLTVIADQIGAPTYARDLAEVIMAIVQKIESTDAAQKANLFGVYHYSNEGTASWYDFATAIIELSKINAEVLPIPTEAYPTPAKRPHYSLMDKQKIKATFGISIPHWRKSLSECIESLGEA